MINSRDYSTVTEYVYSAIGLLIAGLEYCLSVIAEKEN